MRVFSLITSQIPVRFASGKTPCRVIEIHSSLTFGSERSVQKHWLFMHAVTETPASLLPFLAFEPAHPRTSPRSPWQLSTRAHSGKLLEMLHDKASQTWVRDRCFRRCLQLWAPERGVFTTASGFAMPNVPSFQQKSRGINKFCKLDCEFLGSDVQSKEKSTP